MIVEMVAPAQIKLASGRRRLRWMNRLAAANTLMASAILIINLLVQLTESLPMTSQRAVISIITNHSLPSGQASLYRGEVANLWSDLTTLSENLISKSMERGINNINNTNNNKATVVSQNISSIELAVHSNATANGTQQHQSGEDDEGSLILGIIIANILIFIIGFCGNSLVILVILKFTRIETVTDIYILNLAFADIMFLFGLVFLIITMFIDHWVFGELMCKLYMATTSLNQFASSLLLVVMSFDRFLAVCHPIYAQQFRRLRRAKVICLCIWITCLILMTPIFAFAKTNEAKTCAIFWPEYKSFNCEIAFTLYSLAIGFVFPLLLIAAFYTCVIRKLSIAGPTSLGSSRRSRSRESTKKRIEHLVIGIICTYTICWLPYWITQLCVSFITTFEKSPIEGFYPFALIATCLSYTNSALNPILYAFLSDNFKRRCSDVFRSVTSIKWCRQRSPLTDTHSTVATALCEPSECFNYNNSFNNSNKNGNGNSGSTHHHMRPESRQTVVMNESVRLVTSPSQLADILTTTTTSDALNNNHQHHHHHHHHHHHNTDSIKNFRNKRAASSDEAEDKDLQRQHMIGSKLSKLHNSLSSEDYPNLSSASCGNDRVGKHCFSNLDLHPKEAASVSLFGRNEKTRNEEGGANNKGSSKLSLDGSGAGAGGGGMHEEDNEDDINTEEEGRGSHDWFSGSASQGDTRGKRNVAFSVDMIVGQGTSSGNSDQLVKGDRKMILHDSHHRRLQHCQEAV